jgi:hypothetical protein
MIRAANRYNIIKPKKAYYVDATGGNDANNGRSPDAALQTIGQVNGMSFAPGDRILLKRGETWTGTRLDPPDHWLKIADYGTHANKPIIDGNDAAHCVYAEEKNGIRLENIDCAQGLDFGAQFVTCAYITIVECDFHDHGNDGLIFFTGSHHCKVLGGSAYDGYRRLADGRQVSGVEIADGCYDIEVDGMDCYDNTVNGVGITIHNHDLKVMPYNITIRNVNCYGNANHGLQVFKQDDTADSDRNIQIIDSQFGTNTQEGIRIHKAAGADEYPNGVTVDGCEMIANTRYAIWAEGDNLLLQRSIIHEGRCAYFRDFNDLVIYNCTFYLTTWAGYAPLVLADSAIVADGVTVRNCIFASPGDAATYIAHCDITDNVDYDYNMYFRPEDANRRFRYDTALKNFTEWKAAISGDANSSEDDPTFTDEANDDFTLQAGSPAINAGVDVGLSYLGSAPDMGANEKE